MNFTTAECFASAGHALLAELRDLGAAAVPAGTTDAADVYLMARASVEQLVAATGETGTTMIFGSENFDGIAETLAGLANQIPGTIVRSSQVYSFGEAHWMYFTAVLPYGTTGPITATIHCSIHPLARPDQWFQFAADAVTNVPASTTDNPDIDMCLTAIGLDRYLKLIRGHAAKEVRRVKFLEMGIDLEAYAVRPGDDPDWASDPDHM